MTKTDTARFLQVLRAKQAELNATRLGLDSIAIERSADALEEAQHKFERDLAIANFDRESSARHSVAAALARIKDGTFGTCAAAPTRLAIVASRRSHGPRCVFVVRKRRIVVKNVFSNTLSPACCMQRS